MKGDEQPGGEDGDGLDRSVEDQDSRREFLEAEFRKMMEDRFLDGLVRRFEKQFPGHAAHVEDVLFGEILKLVEQTGPLPDNVRGLLTWRLRKRMLDVAKRPLVWGDGEAIEEDDPERKAVRKEMFDQLKAMLDAWENRTMALVVRLTLEAAYYDEILETDDVKDIVSEQLGHDLTTVNVWKLRSRGIRRLAEEVVEMLGRYADDWEIPDADTDHEESEDDPEAEREEN